MIIKEKSWFGKIAKNCSQTRLVFTFTLAFCWKETMRFAFVLLSVNISWLSWYSLFLDERFTHKCSFTKRPTRSKNARHLLVWVYRERCVHIYTEYLCRFCTEKTTLFRHYTMPCAHQSKRRTCVFRTWLRFAAFTILILNNLSFLDPRCHGKIIFIRIGVVGGISVVHYSTESASSSLRL